MNLFHTKGNWSRRGFLGRSLGLMGMTGLPAWYARELLADEEGKSDEKKPDANDRITIGVVGTGGQGHKWALDLAERKDVELVALCDVDGGHLDKCAQEAGAKSGKQIAKYKDFRELTKHKDLQAVVIAAPDHWHALIAVEAMKQKKDVYCESPLALTIAEGRAVAKLAKEKERIFQTGLQQRSDPRFRLAVDLVRNSRLGKVKIVEVHIPGAPKGGPFEAVQIPEGLDWDFWLGPAEKVDFVKERCHFNFRWWTDYSSGSFSDLGVHHFDIVQWALKREESGPTAIDGTAEAPSKERNCYNTFSKYDLHLSYSDGIRLLCTDKGENGVYFEGEEGKWIFVNRERIGSSSKKVLEDKLPEGAPRVAESSDHMGNFLECVRTRKQPICDAETGHRSSTVAQICNIMLTHTKKLKWNPAKEEFDSGPAQKMVERDMRAPWKLDVE